MNELFFLFLFPLTKNETLSQLTVFELFLTKLKAFEWRNKLTAAEIHCLIKSRKQGGNAILMPSDQLEASSLGVEN